GCRRPGGRGPGPAPARAAWGRRRREHAAGIRGRHAGEQRTVHLGRAGARVERGFPHPAIAAKNQDELADREESGAVVAGFPVAPVAPTAELVDGEPGWRVDERRDLTCYLHGERGGGIGEARVRLEAECELLQLGGGVGGGTPCRHLSPQGQRGARQPAEHPDGQACADCAPDERAYHMTAPGEDRGDPWTLP